MKKDDYKKNTKESHVGLVKRKTNYKECVLCRNIYLNLSDHVVKAHRFSRSDPRYDEYGREPPVIPKCYTKFVNGKMIKMCNEELSETGLKYGDIMTNQESDIESLKRLRNKSAELREKINVAVNEEHSSLKNSRKIFRI